MKKFLLICALTLGGNSFFAQLYHVTGQKAISYSIGATKYSFLGRHQIDFNIFRDETSYWKYGVSLDLGTIDKVKYQDYIAHAKFGKILFNAKGKFFLSGVGGVNVGYQNVYSKVLQSNSSSFIYGPTLGGEVEYFVWNGLGLDLEFNQMMTFGSTLSGDSKLFYFHYFLNAGIKYVF